MSATALPIRPSISPSRGCRRSRQRTALPRRASCARITSAWSAGTSSAWRRRASSALAVRQHAQGHGAVGRHARRCSAPTRSPSPRRARQRPPIVVDLALEPGGARQDPHGRAEGRAYSGRLGGRRAGQTDHRCRNGRPARARCMPIGGAKGAALALMVEILSRGADRGQFRLRGQARSSMRRAPPPGVGQLLIAIDPGGLRRRRSVRAAHRVCWRA